MARWLEIVSHKIVLRFHVYHQHPTIIPAEWLWMAETCPADVSVAQYTFRVSCSLWWSLSQPTIRGATGISLQACLGFCTQGRWDGSDVCSSWRPGHLDWFRKPCSGILWINQHLGTDSNTTSTFIYTCCRRKCKKHRKHIIVWPKKCKRWMTKENWYCQGIKRLMWKQ